MQHTQKKAHSHIFASLLSFQMLVPASFCVYPPFAWSSLEAGYSGCQSAPLLQLLIPGVFSASRLGKLMTYETAGFPMHAHDVENTAIENAGPKSKESEGNQIQLLRASWSSPLEWTSDFIHLPTRYMRLRACIGWASN